MAPIEQSTNYIQKPEKPTKIKLINRFMAECTPEFEATSLLSITPEFLSKNGIDTLLLDAEGTFVEFGTIYPDQKIASHLKNLRTQLPQLKVAIVTNKTAKDPASFVTLTHWGDTINADVVITPLDPSWRKPSSRMIHEAMNFFQVPSSESSSVLMAGDKLTGDVRSANRASIRSMIITQIVGVNDHLGDRLVRRPFEDKLLKFGRMRTKWQPLGLHVISDPETDQIFQGTADIESSDKQFSWWSKEDLSQVTEIANRLYGFGIQVPYEIKHTILGSGWLYENGGDVADKISDAQIVFALAAAVSEYQGKKGRAAMFKTLKTACDMLDGMVARRSKRGPTKSGGDKDQTDDKIAALITETAMVLKDHLSPADFFIRFGSDAVMNSFVRKELEKRGVDTGSVIPGKVATSLVNVADIISPLLKEIVPELSEIIAKMATGSKVGRIPLNADAMNRREELRRDQIPELEQIYAELTQAA